MTNTTDITPILQAVFYLILAVIGVFVVPYIKSKTTVDQQHEIIAWVRIAVSAAEQIYKGVGRGEEKKEYVLDWLAEKGIKVDADEIDALIESAVFELNKDKEPKAEEPKEN